MTIKCPECDTSNPSDSKYCKECATALPSPEDIEVTETMEAAQEELTTGSTFGERYQIIEELGKGGMGRVYRVLDKKLKEEIALKLIKPEIASDKKTVERFSNELKIARKIGHKNVARMFDLNEEQGTHYITMEYVRGEDLKRLIRKMGPFSAGQAIPIAKQICEGLGEAHRLGVVHRDLKPQNVMVDEGGNARLMDFGIARSLESKGITGAGVMVGTPEYMSPEQVEGKEAGQSSDIYSLGVILYEMVTGGVPFEGDTPFTIGVKHKSEMPKDPKDLNAQIPEDLSSVIMRCLEKDKEKRYQSSGEVRSELENIQKGIPTTERVIPKRKPITSREITVTFGLKKFFIPVLVFLAIAIVGVIIWRFAFRKKAVPLTPGKPSIAVLPLVDLSQQKDQGYFCDGMTEAIIEKLSQISGLKVSSRTSVMRYKNTDKDIKEISRELDVASILEGSVQKEEDNIRVHAQLINVEDNFHIWSDHYDRKLTSVFAIQSDIAQHIAKVLKAKLSPEEKEKIAKKPTESLSAYDYYLKGREYYVRYRREDNEHAIELFKKALESDPNFALAYSGLGDSYAQRAIKFGFPPRWLDESIEVSQKAISLDIDLSEGYKALGLAYHAKGLYRKSIEANRKAIEFNPNNEQAIGNLGWSYYYKGDFDRALLWFKKALAMAPIFNYSFAQMGVVYYALGDFTRAEQWFNKALELQPDFLEGLSGLINCYLAQGKYQQAIEQIQKWLAMAPSSFSALNRAGMTELFIGNYERAQQYYQKSCEIQSYSVNLTALGYIYWKKGQQDEARELFKQSLMLSQQELSQGNEYWRFPHNIAAINAIQDNKEEAYKWLKKAIDAGWRDFKLGMRDPLLENLHEDEQFKQMMAQVKAMVDEMRNRVEKEL